MIYTHVKGVPGEVVTWLEVTTGLGIGWLIAIAVLIFLFLNFFGGSGKGRGRRYRRGFKVAYLETLGKERAKMRAEHERAKDHKPREH